MKIAFRHLLFPIFLVAGLAFPPCVHAQVTAGYTPTKVTATGQVGPTISYAFDGAASSNFTVDWSVTGTAPSVCTLSVDGSSDKVTWYSLSGSLSCTSSNMVHINGKPTLYQRVSVTTYTAGDATTQVTVHYTRGN